MIYLTPQAGPSRCLGCFVCWGMTPRVVGCGKSAPELPVSECLRSGSAGEGIYRWADLAGGGAVHSAENTLPNIGCEIPREHLAENREGNPRGKTLQRDDWQKDF